MRRHRCVCVRVRSVGHAIGISKALSRRRTAPRTCRNRRNIRLRKGRPIGAHRYARQGVRFHGSSIRPGAWGRHLFGLSKGLIIILSQITGKSCDEFTTIRDSGFGRSIAAAAAAAFSQGSQTLMRVVDQYITIEARLPPISSFSWIPHVRPSPLPRCTFLFSEKRKRAEDKYQVL